MKDRLHISFRPQGVKLLQPHGPLGGNCCRTLVSSAVLTRLRVDDSLAFAVSVAGKHRISGGDFAICAAARICPIEFEVS